MAEPQFNPNQPYEEIPAEETPQFDESKEFQDYEEPAAAAQEESPLLGGMLQTAREAVSGATLGLSEPYFAGTIAIEQTVADLLAKKDFESAQKVIDQAKQYYKADLERQEKFKQESPTISTTAELMGSLAPGGLAMKVAGAGIQGAKSFGQVLSHAAKTGAAAGVIHQAGQEIAKAPVEPTTTEDQLKRIGTAGAVGAVAAPVITAGAAGVMAGASAAKSKVAPYVKKWATSEPGLRVVQMLLGPKVDTQRKFLAMQEEIDKLPDNEAIVSFFETVKDRINEQKETSKLDYDEALGSLKNLERRYDEEIKTAKGGLRERLQTAKDSLSVIVEGLQQDRAIVSQEAQVAKKEIQSQLVDPSMGPHVQTVETALNEMKVRIKQGSDAARNSIDPSYVMPRSVIVREAKKQLQSLGIRGVEGEPLGVTDARKSAIEKINRFIKSMEDMPEVLTGEQIKDVIQQIDDEVSTLLPGRFGQKADNAFKGIRKAIDTELKDNNEEYRLLMQPVAEMSAFLEDASSQMPSASSIEAKLRQAPDNPRVGELFSRLKQYTGVDTLEPIYQLQAAKEARAPGRMQALVNSHPAMQELEKIDKLIKFSRTKDFNQAVYASVKDQAIAQQIIQLREEILNLTDPTYVQAQINKAVEAGQVSVSEAAILENMAAQKRDEAVKRAANFVGYRRGEQALGKILRASESPSETTAASQLMDAISSLPEKEFEDLFKLINLSDPKQAQQFFEAVRVRHAMTFPRTQGSRRVNLFGALGAGIGAQLGSPAISAFFGAFSGAYLDEFGGKVAQAYLRRLNRMGGLPTAKKMSELSPVPLTSTARTALALQVGDMVRDVDSQDMMAVSEEKKAEIYADIKASQLNSVAKAKAVSDLQNGLISGKTVKALMLEGLSQSSPLIQTTVKLTEPPAQSTLQQDKPDVLKKLSRSPSSEAYAATEEPSDESVSEEDLKSQDEVIAEVLRRKGFSDYSIAKMIFSMRNPKGIQEFPPESDDQEESPNELEKAPYIGVGREESKEDSNKSIAALFSKFLEKQKATYEKMIRQEMKAGASLEEADSIVKRKLGLEETPGIFESVSRAYQRVAKDL